ncbi:hypothetical protein CSPX01_05239 [Colletotrichum filicis]|nr:hypothetical protein CSPX01_05239 [Colletotrichum filicis]
MCDDGFRLPLPQKAHIVEVLDPPFGLDYPLAPRAYKGEQAASALEANLTNLEGRLDALLAAFESTQEPNEDGTVAPPPGHDAKKPDDTVLAKTPNCGTQSSESKSPEAAKKA